MSSLLLLGCSIWLLVNVLSIARNGGEVQIIERNVTILMHEIALFSFMTLFALGCTIYSLRKAVKQR